MKHLSASFLQRAVAAAELATEDELKAKLRARLGDGVDAKAALARQLGVTELRLTHALRGAAMTPKMAKALGYRLVVRFERVSEDEGRGAAFQTRK